MSYRTKDFVYEVLVREVKEIRYHVLANDHEEAGEYAVDAEKDYAKKYIARDAECVDSEREAVEIHFIDNAKAFYENH